MGTPNCAGSSGLWPPAGNRLPPTKATEAKEYTEASSPIVLSNTFWPGKSGLSEMAGWERQFDRLTQGTPDALSNAVHRPKPLRVAGRENHCQFRIGLEQARPDIEKRRFFAVQRAAGYDQAHVGSQLPELPGCFGFYGGAHVEFQIACYQDSLRQAADCFEPVSICFALGQNAAEPAQERPPESAEPPVAGPGAIGDAGVDHGHGDSAAEAAAEQVGPEFGFSQDEKVGLECVEVGADGPGQVQRAIEDAVRAEAIAGQGLAGAGSGGDQQSVIGQGAIDSQQGGLRPAPRPLKPREAR